MVAIYLVPIIFKAQTVPYRQFTTREGLLSDEIYNIHQDKFGYIWFFSRYGTVKYNGTDFIPVLTNLPFKDAFIYSIYENDKGNKWVANSNARIYEVRNDSAYIINGIENISTELRNSVSEIYQLIVDDTLNIYAVTKRKCYKFKKKGSNYHPELFGGVYNSDSVRLGIFEIGNSAFGVYNRKKHDEFISASIKKQRYIQFSDTKELIRFDFDSYSAPFRHIKKINGGYYFSYSSYISKIKHRKSISQTNFGAVVLNFFADKNKHIWIGCLNNGVFEIDENDSIVNHYLAQTTVNDIKVDFQNGIWASTVGRGVFRFNNKRNGLKGDVENLALPLSFLKKIKNRLFVANIKGEVFLIQKGTVRKIREADNNSPTDIAEHQLNYIIPCTFSIENINLNKSFLEKNVLTKESPKLYRVFSKSADTLIFVWRRGILISVKGVHEKYIDFGRKVLSCEIDGNNLWLGTENGVYIFSIAYRSKSRNINGELLPDNVTLKESKYLEEISTCEVTSIVRDKQGHIWFCTHGDGFFKLNGNKLFHYSIGEGSPSSVVHNINFMPDGSALLSTNLGLFRSRPIVTNMIARDWTRVVQQEVKEAVFFENYIYYSSTNGIGVVRNDLDNFASNQVKFNLSSIEIDSKIQSKLKDFEVSGNHQNITFKFDRITFEETIPEVSFRLDGPTFFSGTTESSQLLFGRLEPGTYLLTVFPKIKAGEGQSIRIPFQVLPMFYQTALFISVAVFTGLFGLAGIVWLFIFIQKKRQAAKTRNEQLILEYKLIALKAQINPHFMSNCLSAIQNLIVSNKNERATAYIAKFGLMVRKILDFSSQVIISLYDEIELLKIYVELEQLRFDNKFTFEININRSVDINIYQIPPLLLNPIVENAIWHGLLPVQNSRNGKLKINIKCENEQLVIEVTDNGVGRVAQNIVNYKKHSLGINLTEQRLNNINYITNSITARMEYIDLKDNKGQAAGTTVLIYLPIQLISSQYAEN